MSGDGTWPVSDAAAPGDTAGGGAPSALEGFASGGLIGLMAALDLMSSERDDSVDDPEALRLAEEAVAHDRPIPDGPMQPIDEEWAVVARQTGTLVVGLDEVARMLEAEGVSIGWDPFDPRESVAFTPPGIGTGPKTYAVMVPESQFGLAREVLYGAPPQGVTYAWKETSDSMPASGDVPTAVTSYGGRLSDNDRLSNLAAGRGGSGAAVAFAVVLGIIGIIVALIVSLRG